MKISKKQLLTFQRAAQRQAFINAGGCDGRFRKRVVGSKKRYDRSSEKRRWKKEW
jgi:predicted metal-binding protein